MIFKKNNDIMKDVITRKVVDNMVKKTSNYDENSIKILEGLEAVRKRPGMYIGSTDKRGLHHLVWEIVDNGVDEALNGYGDHLKIVLHKDGSISVTDSGRGIPTGMHSSGKSTPEVIYTVLHAGGKFSEGGYKVSGGLHGVGASVVNALSSWLEVTTRYNGYEYFISFKDGGHIDQKLKKLGSTNKTGTTVRFMPDKEIFSTTTFNFSTICERMQECAFLINGLTIEIIDEIENKEERYLYKNGLESFCKYLNEGKNTLHKVLCFDSSKDNVNVSVALQYTDSYSDNIVSFVNNVKTTDGGTHEVGFKTAITKVLNDYAKENGFIKAREKSFEGTDVREGLTAIISVQIPEDILQFEGQTKSKLGTPIARSIVEAITTEQLKFFLEENKSVATMIVNKALKGKAAREAARKAREETRKGKDSKKLEKILSGKLTPAQTKDKKVKELFIVEGDSAGGSAKQGRNRKTQAILPLRGKVINTEKAKIEDIFKNEEINTLIHTVGAGYGSNFNVKDINYDKVIIMTDADDDGAHIQCLLLTFFYRYMKPLIEEGHLYIAMPPLYKVTLANKEHYLWTNEELKELTKGKNNYKIQRYKGLGEMNPDQLWDTTLNPETRTLFQVTIEDAAKAEKMVSLLMGDVVEPRKNYMYKYAEF